MTEFVGIIREFSSTDEAEEQPLYQIKNEVNEEIYDQDERYRVVFNGEIYNTVELRGQLGDIAESISTTSVMELLLALFKRDQTEMFKQLRGKFAVLICDKQEDVVYGARDHFGIKSLYIYETEESTYFSSNKESLCSLIDDERINLEALQHYFSFQFVPDPFTLTEGIKQVQPGHYFIKKQGVEMSHHRYWHANFHPVLSDENQVKKKIRDVLYESVNTQMSGELTIGSLLSGGIDSSIIVAIAREINPNLITFSVGFDQDGYSEVNLAKETAAKLNVENISYLISPEEYVGKLTDIIWHMKVPLADPSCIPLYFAAREASKHVEAVLSGEGADELFGGYNIYHEPNSLKLFQWIPTPVKKLLGRVTEIMPEGVKGKSFIERGITPLNERYIGNAKIFEEREKQQLLKLYNSAHPYQSVTEKFYDQVKGQHPVNQMQYIDMHTWLPGDILLKADKMTGAHGVKLRTPFLDPDVFHVASQLSLDMKLSRTTTKRVLREAFRGIVPDDVVDRRKLGFPVPIRHWLKNELYDWAKMLISESATDHLLHKDYVLNLLDLHCKDKHDYSREIWTVLIFMLWHQVFVEVK